MSENQKITSKAAEASGQESLENKGGLSMSPPAFQLKADGVGSEDNNGSNAGIKQLKAPDFALSSSPMQQKGAEGGGGDIMSQMGQAMGTDFSGVKVHTDSNKATEMGALAYTQGEELHFAPGQYNPASQSGKELIGHELSHVKQQREGRVQANTSIKGQAVNNNAGLEKEADDLGKKAANFSGGPVAQAKNDKKASKATAQAKVIQQANNPITMVINYIQGEMIRNFASTEVAEIKANLRNSIIFAAVPGMGPYYSYKAYRKWYDMVRTGGPWDHKSILRSTFGNWTDDAAMSTSYFYDIWSNLHYGFIGKECGFDEWTLLAGAGAAQVMAGTVPPGYWQRRFQTLGDADVFAAFDDPKDQEAIRVGFRLHGSSGSSVNSADILGQVRAASASLSTMPMAASTPGAGSAAGVGANP